ncbi:uncharacterized protein LOC124451502 isoform X2 [Xenia sp. Carnegie-2017]|uniref:uncharacterized protein LOC124451502 isoform X2 n=1 Tax=Xenia sp. Carnegie-2017 TaxID=2897299 RepID=UPI001F043496|nr:uncharacterized protein LOC124451502 isoform X2 [Xenia sp. Carnegie-2017]
MIYFINIFAHMLLLVGLFRLATALSCDVSGERRFKCVDDVHEKYHCPKTCCYNKTASPSCYFTDKDYGLIQHANGLCVIVRESDGLLVWSSNCTMRNAFFLVSYDYPIYIAETGRCVLPTNLRKKVSGRRKFEHSMK